MLIEHAGPTIKVGARRGSSTGSRHCFGGTIGTPPTPPPPPTPKRTPHIASPTKLLPLSLSLRETDREVERVRPELSDFQISLDPLDISEES